MLHQVSPHLQVGFVLHSCFRLRFRQSDTNLQTEYLDTINDVKSFSLGYTPLGTHILIDNIKHQEISHMKWFAY